MRFLAPVYTVGRNSDVTRVRVHVVGAMLIMIVIPVPMEDRWEVKKNKLIYRDHCGVPFVQHNVFVLITSLTFSCDVS